MVLTNRDLRENTKMILKKLPYALTVCKVKSPADIDINLDFYFIGRTDQEFSLVCKTENTPLVTTDRDDGWRGLYIEGTLDFSLVGVLSKISAILADNQISIFAVSTYNTDYILVKTNDFEKALAALAEKGYRII